MLSSDRRTRLERSRNPGFTTPATAMDTKPKPNAGCQMLFLLVILSGILAGVIIATRDPEQDRRDEAEKRVLMEDSLRREIDRRANEDAEARKRLGLD